MEDGRLLVPVDIGHGVQADFILSTGNSVTVLSQAFAERFTSRASEIALDATVFGYALGAAVLASVFFTMLPTLPGGTDAGAALTRAGTRTTGGSRSPSP